MIEVCGSLVGMVCQFAVLAFNWCCSTQFCNECFYMGSQAIRTNLSIIILKVGKSV